MSKPIRMNLENYLTLEHRWNDIHYLSRRQLLVILKSDFDVEAMNMRKLNSLEERARKFYKEFIASQSKAIEKYKQEQANYEQMVKSANKCENIKKPRMPEIVDIPELMTRPKDGNLEIRFDHHMKKADKTLAKKRRIHFVTSGQIGADGFKAFWRAIKQYQAYRHAAVWVGTSTYGPLKIDADSGIIESSMDPMFNGHIVLNENIRFNENIQINTMRLRPTLRYPLGGLSSTEGEGSEIYIHPKNDLRYVAQTTKQLPRAQAASASCTIPDYSRNKLGQQDKTGELAQKEHVFGGWVIEIEDEKIFHMRPIVADEHGCFCDSFYTKKGKFISKKFTPTGVQDVAVSAIVTGDDHFAVKPKIELPWKIGPCPKVYEATYGPKGIINELKIPEVFAHDTFDGHSISHHNEKDSILLQHMYEAGLLDLRAELDNYWQEYAKRIKATNSNVKFYDVASNHPEHLLRYITEERFNKRLQNKRIGMELWLDAANDPFCNPLEKYSRKFWAKQENNNVVFLKRDEDVSREGIKLDMHGDKGANGSRASDKQLHNLGIRCIVGHRHTPGINGLVWTVGTSTHLKVQYTKGLSSWVNTHCLIYKGGQRQLINIINGKYAYNPAEKAA